VRMWLLGFLRRLRILRVGPLCRQTHEINVSICERNR
jgi:hypothetical protein